jgi:hypothetical protein
MRIWRYDYFQLFVENYRRVTGNTKGIRMTSEAIDFMNMLRMGGEL